MLRKQQNKGVNNALVDINTQGYININFDKNVLGDNINQGVNNTQGIIITSNEYTTLGVNKTQDENKAQGDIYYQKFFHCLSLFILFTLSFHKIIALIFAIVDITFFPFKELTTQATQSYNDMLSITKEYQFTLIIFLLQRALPYL